MPDNRPATYADHGVKDLPLHLRLNGDDGRGGMYGWDDRWVMWIDTPVRRRTYICSRGVTHRRYWRMSHRDGDRMACEHEVVTVIDRR